jgi:hypothetical protein
LTDFRDTSNCLSKQTGISCQSSPHLDTIVIVVVVDPLKINKRQVTV